MVIIMMLSSTYNVLIERKNDLYMMIEILKSLKKVEESAILKSSIILMNYNIIEGVFYALLQELFDYFTDKNIDIEKWYKDFANTIAIYHYKNIESPKGKKIATAQNLLKFRKLNIISVPDFEEYGRVNKLFSGNLDQKQIRCISKDYFGVNYRGKQGDEYLEKIKEIRNKLAHGELKYSEACRNFTNADIEKYSISVCDYMKRVIDAFCMKYSNKL